MRTSAPQRRQRPRPCTSSNLQPRAVERRAPGAQAETEPDRLRQDAGQLPDLEPDAGDARGLSLLIQRGDHAPDDAVDDCQLVHRDERTTLRPTVNSSDVLWGSALGGAVAFRTHARVWFRPAGPADKLKSAEVQMNHATSTSWWLRLVSVLPALGLGCGGMATAVDRAGSMGGGSGGTSMGGTGAGSGGSAGGSAAGGQGGTGGSAAWRPFSNASPWNTPIGTNPAIDPNSSAMITDLSTISGQTTFWINIQDYSVPVYWVDSTATPAVTVVAALGGTGFRGGAASDSVAGGTGTAPIPSGATPAAGTDMHLAIINRALGMEWGMWDAVPPGTGWTAGEASTIDLTGDGVRPPERDNPWWAGHGPRACGFPLIAGLITEDDVTSGAIEHALVIAYSHIRSSYYTPPASSAQGTTGTAQPTGNGILCGGQIQLDPTLDVTTLGLSPVGLMIARALQKYGAFVGDYSGATSLYADASPTAQAYWNGVLGNGEVQAIPLNRFRVLQIGTTYDNMN